MPEPLSIENAYTDAEFTAFAEQSAFTRYELIDGYIFALASPSEHHQNMLNFINNPFQVFFAGKKCRVYLAFDVHINKDISRNINVYQPDILVVCDKDKIKTNGVYGAPDLIVEITSPSTSKHDYTNKLYNYLKYGVKEYWIVAYNKISIFILDNDEVIEYHYTYKSIVESKIFPGLKIDFNMFKEFL